MLPLSWQDVVYMRGETGKARGLLWQPALGAAVLEPYRCLPSRREAPVCTYKYCRCRWYTVGILSRVSFRMECLVSRPELDILAKVRYQVVKYLD